MAGLKISTFCLAIKALFSLRMSSSVFPENMEPQMTSICPLVSFVELFPITGSKNITNHINYRSRFLLLFNCPASYFTLALKSRLNRKMLLSCQRVNSFWNQAHRKKVSKRSHGGFGRRQG